MKNKHTIFLILLLLSQILFGQKINKNLDNAKKAIAAKEYAKAIKLYEKLISKDRYNDSLHLDLANLYFSTNKVQKACDCINLIDRVNNKIADTLVEKCKNYPIKVKYLKDVDVPPMFLYKNQYYNLVINDRVNPVYLECIWSHLVTYKPYYYGIIFKKNLIIDVKIDEKNTFIGTTSGFDDNLEQTDIRDSIRDIVGYRIEYKSAIYNKKPVKIFEDYSLKMERLNK